MLALRQFAVLANVDLSELAMVAENVHETTLLAGNRIVAAGAHVPALHLIMEGRIESGDQVYGTREVYGLLEVLARRPSTAPAIAVVDTRVFRIPAGDAREIFEDNIGVLRAVLAELSTRLLAHGPRLGFGPPMAAAGERMTLVERMIALRQHSPLAGGRLQALTAVAQRMEEQSWQAGEVIVEAGVLPERIILVLAGALKIGDSIVGPGDSVGTLEAFAGVPYTAAIHVATTTTALVCPVAGLLDVIEDYTDLGLAISSTLAGRLLDVIGTRSN